MNSQASQAAPYGVILHFRRLDVSGVHPLFSGELAAAFAELGMGIRIIEDYHDLAAVGAAMADPDCRFFLCYNGFGSEIRLRDGGMSAYSAFGKPLIDFMHDCPANDAMQHQVASIFPERHLFLTDVSYLAVAREMGFANVRFVPSITFPGTIGDVPPWHDRPIEVLFPAGLPDPEIVLRRLRGVGGGSADRLAKNLFDQAVARTSDWRVNPLAELRRACRDAGFPLDFSRADSRFLFTAVADFMHVSRRRELLAAISHLPVTVMSDASLPAGPSALKIHPPGSISDVMRLMARSKAVLCPPAHPAGFHERILGALGAGALTIEASNSLMDALFADGAETLLYENAAEAVLAIERVFAGDPQLPAIAARGRAIAAERYSPLRAAARFLGAVRKFHLGRPDRAAEFPGPGGLIVPPTVKVSGLHAVYDALAASVPAKKSVAPAERDMAPAYSYMLLSQEYHAVKMLRIVRLAQFVKRGARLPRKIAAFLRKLIKA